MTTPAAIRRFIIGLFIINSRETGALRNALRTGITSSVTIVTACAIFGTTIGPMSLFGAMLAQWESGRALLARIKTGLMVGSAITLSMAVGVLIAPLQWLVIPATVAIILATSTAYYAFVLTRGPGPLHLFYAAAIGSYFGLFGDIGWHAVGMTGFACLLTALLTLAFLIPDLHRPEKQAVFEADEAVAAFEREAAARAGLDHGLRVLRHRAYFAVNRAWLMFQDNAIGPLRMPAQRAFTAAMLDINRRLGAAIAARAFPGARLVHIEPDTPAMLGRPSLSYLFAHGFRRHSIAWFTAWRIGLAAGISGALTQGLALGHPYWAILTSTIVLHLWIGRLATTRRAIHRAAGTVLGLGVVALVGFADPAPWVLVAVIVACVIAMCITLPLNYAVAMIFVTPMSLLSIEAATGGPVRDLILDRLVETLIGAGIAVAVTWVTGLRAPRRLVRDQFRRTVAAIRRTLAVIEAGRALAPEGRRARVELLFELQSNNAVLTRATEEDAALEPWHEAETIIGDLGYLTLGAYWIANPGECLSARAAMARLDALIATLEPLDRDADDPARIAAALSDARDLLLQPAARAA